MSSESKINTRRCAVSSEAHGRGECVPFARIHQRANAVPAEPKRVRRERTNTPNRTGKQQQKCLDILVEFV